MKVSFVQEDQDPDKPDKCTAMAKASPSNAESSSGGSPPFDRKDDLGEYINSPLQTLLLHT